ncbi:MAG: hypothetical protein ACLQF1_01275 [Methyloceanibacter sp.]
MKAELQRVLDWADRKLAPLRLDLERGCGGVRAKCSMRASPLDAMIGADLPCLLDKQL